MRTAYLIVGVGVLIVGGTAFFAFNHGFTQTSNTKIPMADTDTETLALSSSAFENGGLIPEKYTCDGDKSLSPQILISGVPPETKSLVLIMDDPDVPRQLKPDGVFDHWVLFDIPPDTQEVPEGSTRGSAGLNGAGEAVYTGPCPPKEYEPSEHRYVFTLYALNTPTMLFEKTPTKDDVLAAMKEHVLVEAQLIGRYKKK